MIKLIFEGMKCHLKVECINPDSSLEQPFCDYCCRPMFLVKTVIKEDSTDE